MKGNNMNFVEFHFSSGKTMPVQIEYSNEEIFRIFFRKMLPIG